MFNFFFIFSNSIDNSNNEKKYFKKFHKDSIFRIEYASNWKEKLCLGIIIFITIVLCAIRNYYLKKDNEYVYPVSIWEIILLISVITTIVRLLTIEYSWKYFKNNILHNFISIFVLLNISVLISVPISFLLNPTNGFNGEFKDFIDFMEEDITDEDEGVTRQDIWALISGILMSILIPIYINNIIRNHYMKYITAIFIVIFLIITMIEVINVGDYKKFYPYFLNNDETTKEELIFEV